MSFNNSELMAIISGLVGHNNVIVIPTAFIEATGDKDSAHLLAQCLFWQGKLKNGREWFWKTDVDWQTELYMSRHELTKAKNKLKSLGILNTMVKKANGDPTCHYQVPADALINWFCRKSAKRNAEIQQNDLPPDSKTFSRETAEPLTETTSKTTNRIEERESLSRIENFENNPSQNQPQSQTPTSTKKFFDEASVGVVVGKSTAKRKNPHGVGGDDSCSAVAVDKGSSVDAQGVPGLSSEDVTGIVNRVTEHLNNAIGSTFPVTVCQKHVAKCLRVDRLTEAQLFNIVAHVKTWIGTNSERHLNPAEIFGSRASEYAHMRTKNSIYNRKRKYYLENPKLNPDTPLIDEDDIPIGTDAWDLEGRIIHM